MKRLTVLFTLLVLLIHPAKAQRFKVGILAGVNISDVDGMDPVDADNDFHKFGFTAGGLVSTHLGDKTVVQMEIAYSQLGSSMPPDTSQNNFNNNDYYTFRLDYANIDLAVRRMIHFNLNKKPTNKFGIEGGLSVGYLFHYYYTVKSYAYSIDLNTENIGAFAGFSYNFTPGFCVDVRYYNSITSVIKHNAYNSQFLYYNSWNLGRNVAFQITFRFTFGEGSNSTPAEAPAPAASNPSQ